METGKWDEIEQELTVNNIPLSEFTTYLLDPFRIPKKQKFFTSNKKGEYNLERSKVRECGRVPNLLGLERVGILLFCVLSALYWRLRRRRVEDAA